MVFLQRSNYLGPLHHAKLSLSFRATHYIQNQPPHERRTAGPSRPPSAGTSAPRPPQEGPKRRFFGPRGGGAKELSDSRLSGYLFLYFFMIVLSFCIMFCVVILTQIYSVVCCNIIIPSSGIKCILNALTPVSWFRYYIYWSRLLRFGTNF